jgi:hypothetical protein
MLDKTFPVSGRLELHCEFRSGSLNIQAQDDLSEARVTITPRDAGLPVEQLFRVELTGDRLDVVELPENGGSLLQSVLGGDLRSLARGRILGGAEVDIVVELPAGSPVRAAVSSAAVRATGRIGTTSISAGSSTIELELVDGELKVRGGSGSVSVDRVTGEASVKGGSGRIRIGESDGELSLTVGSGQLEIGTAHGEVRSRSGSGTTVIELAERNVDIASSSGPVTIGLRAGQQARLDVATGSGRLRTEMPVQEARPEGEAITIRVRTGSGDVILRRAAVVAG